MGDHNWFVEGIEYYLDGEYEKAIIALEKAIVINPEDAYAWNIKGYALYELKKYEEALKTFEKATQIDPNESEAWTGKGFTLYKLEKYEKALKSFEKAIEINPLEDRAWEGVGIILYELGRYKDAIDTLTTILKDHKSVTLYNTLGELYLSLGDLENAYKTIKESLKLNSSHTTSFKLLGKVKIEEKDYNTAREYFRKAISLDPGDPLLILWDGYARYLKTEFSFGQQDNKYQEEMTAIIRNLEKANELAEKRGDKKLRAYILYFLGSLYFKNNNVFMAKKRLEECINLNSGASIEGNAREVLDYLWTNKIRPIWWKWWLESPIHKIRREITFLAISGLIFTLFLLSPLVPKWFHLERFSYSVYLIFIAFLIFILISPNIRHIKAQEIEVEVHAPPSFEPTLSPIVMESKLKEMEKTQ